MNEPKITYLLGAGASYYSFPIINALQKQMEAMPQSIAGNLSGNELEILGALNFYALQYKELHNTLNWEDLSFILAELELLGKYSKKYSTIDTYALYNKHNNPDKYTKIKHLMNAFFTFWQSQANDDYTKEGQMAWEEIDPRYIALISAFINNENNEKIISDNINFISWNYDTQLEKTISLFLPEGENTLLNVCEKIGVHPINEINKSKIIHLNGITGFLNDNGKYSEIEFNKGILKEHKLKELGKIVKNEIINNKPSDYLKFSWDLNGAEYDNIIGHCKNIISNTDYLVIIGYSFPQFNRKIDLELINSVIKDGSQIIIQNPAIDETIFNEYFGLKYNTAAKNLKFYSPQQFFIPGEYFGKKNNYGKYNIR